MAWAVTLLGCAVIVLSFHTWRLARRLDKLQRRLARLVSDLAVAERESQLRDGPGRCDPMTKA